MKIKKFLGLSDVVIVDDATLIRALASDEKIDREFKLHHLLNRFALKRSIKDLSYNGTRFPHMLPRFDALRLKRHTELWDLFNAEAARMSAGAMELEPIARWVRKKTPELQPRVLAQQLIGQFFNPAFQATEKSWEAAIIFHENAVTANFPKWLWWQLTGKAQRAKKVLASVTNDDIVAMHGIGVALHNLVTSIHKLSALYQDANTRGDITPDKAVDLTLTAPPVVLRQALSKGAVAGCPYTKFTLFLLKLKDANRDNHAKDLIFMSGSWSRCPAAQWIPAVIAGIWKRVMQLETDEKFLK
jgi:hypothetical protein